MPLNPANNIELLIFDLDGTLVDSRKDITHAVNVALKTVGRPPKTQEEISRLIGKGLWSLVKQALFDDEKALKIGFAAFLAHYERNLLEHTTFFPGVEHTLSKFQDRKLAVLSNKQERFCQAILSGLGCSEYFGIILGGDSLETRKPDPEPILHICEILDVSPTKTVMVGDSPIDVQAGKSAGVMTVGLTQGFTPEEVMNKSGADLLIPNVASLSEKICELENHARD